MIYIIINGITNAIDVIDIKTGMSDVQSYEDCHTMKDAIRVALIGAGLIF